MINIDYLESLFIIHKKLKEKEELIELIETSKLQIPDSPSCEQRKKK